MRISRSLALVFWLCLVGQLWAQAASESALKVAYIYNFLKYVKWLDEGLVSEFVVGLHGRDEALYAELSRMLADRKVRSRGIRVLHVDDLEQARDVHLLVLAPSKNNDISRIANAVHGSNTLLLTDGCTQKQLIMINLYRLREGRIGFEVNRPNIVYEGLEVTPDLLLKGGGTELDVAMLYREMEAALHQSRQTVADQQIELERQLAEIDQREVQLREQNAQIRAQQTEIEQREDQLRQQGRALEQQREEMARNAQEAARYARELQTQLDTLAARESEMAALTEQIQASRLVLAEQRGEIAQQSGELRQQESELEAQGTTIKEQQALLRYGSVIAVLIAALAVVVYWSYRQKKRSNVQLQEARDLADRANAAKSTFLANMSHEIRTPMNGIVGMVDMLKRSPLESHQLDQLAVIDTSADALLELINDILDLSKIEAGGLELERVEFALWDVLEGVMKLMAMRAHEKGLELVCHVHPGVPEGLTGDPTRLRQIVVNLIGNAIKFTTEGEITVEVRCESRNETEAQLRVAVRDTGVGIPADKQALIFEAFSQADSSTTREYGGTGLGLDISRQLVELMGGRIWVESELGVGSTFQFTAPFGVSDARVAIAASEPWKGLDDARLLVVEGNGTNRLVLEQMLDNWGFQVEVADTGAGALAALERVADSRPYDLVLFDGHLPDLPGRDLARRVHELSGAATSMMLLTSIDGQELIDEVRAAGVVHFLRKPITQSDLLDGILTALKVKPASATDVSQPVDDDEIGCLRILLADDNPTNRYVATSMIESFGHQIVAVGDGAQALAQVQESSFDLVLMDVQMPEMDGYEATAQIRSHEAGGDSRLPIIGLTANAMKGDREACLAAGMDDYVAKPVRWETLKEAIVRVGVVGSTPVGAEDQDDGEDGASELDAVLDDLGLERLDEDDEAKSTVDPGVLQRLEEEFATPDGDQVLDGAALDELREMEARGAISVHEIVELFHQSGEDILPALHQALAQREAGDLEREAHTLKGSARDLGALRLAAVCQRLEDLGREESFAGAADLITGIEAAFEEAKGAIDAYLA